MFRVAVVRLLLCLLTAAASPLPTAHAAAWSSAIDEREGLPLLTRGGSPVMTSSYAFWGANWAWAQLQSNFKISGPFDYAVSGRNQALDFDLSARITLTQSRQWQWVFDLVAASAKTAVIGGGISFKFDLASIGAEMGEPVMLPGNMGWAWGTGSKRVEMRFDPPLAAVYFERGRKEEIRAFFYSGSIAAGARRITGTLTVGEDIALAPTLGERFGLDDGSAWPQNVLDWKTSPVDLSFLNASEKPAGRRGFVKASGDALVFGDGTPARFWGTNVTSYALFRTPRDAVQQQAKRLSALGFNLVRIHHHDSAWVSPNIFGDKSGSDTQSLDPTALDKLDWWIKCLKDEGIYVWLDLHVERPLKEGDRIYGFDEIRKGKATASLKGYNYVNVTIQQAMKAFNSAYLNHRNAYTNTAYKDEPAIAALLITNENDVTHHFGNALLPDKKVPLHNRLYTSEADAFARAHGLPKDRTWRAWEPGPSKLFLNDLERRFNVDMIDHLRTLGAKAPIATTSSWGANPLFSLPALTAGDLIDAHSYGGVGQLERNPVDAANFVHWMAAAQVAGKPVSVTEWSAEPFPTPDRHTFPLYVASQASLQGWDALMQYAYSQIPFSNAGTPSNWHAFNDPALIATLPAAALMYRQGHVREASTTYAFDPGPDALFGQAITPSNSAMLRTAAERGKLVIAMPWVKSLPWLERSAIPPKAHVMQDPHQLLVDQDAAEVSSDTGELRRNWDKGLFTIDTPRTQAAMGWIGGEKLTLDDVEIAASTRNATVAVQSLDGAPIARSKNLMISLGARSVPAAGNKLPFRSEPVDGRLIIRAPKGLKLYKSGTLQQMKEIAVPYEKGRYVITLDKSLETYWLVLRAPQP